MVWRPSRIAPSRWVAVTSGPSIVCEGHRFAQNLLARKRRRRGEQLRYNGIITSAQCHKHDLGRDAEAERHDAAAEAAGDDDITIFARVAIREFLAVLRRHHR